MFVLYKKAKLKVVTLVTSFFTMKKMSKITIFVLCTDFMNPNRNESIYLMC